MPGKIFITRSKRTKPGDPRAFRRALNEQADEFSTDFRSEKSVSASLARSLAGTLYDNNVERFTGFPTGRK